MLELLILEDIMWQKLAIMECLIHNSKGTYSINTLASELNLSYTKAANLVTELANDLATHFEYEILGKDNKLSWNPEKYNHNAYIQHLFRDSAAYRFIMTTLLRPDVSFKQFCNSMFLSQSTVLRKLKPLKTMLLEYGLILTPTKMTIVGNESILRILYTTYMWAGDHGELLESWSFDFTLEKKITRQLLSAHGTFMHPKELFLRLAVSRIRYEQGHHLQEVQFTELTQSRLCDDISKYTTQFINDSYQQVIHTRYICSLLYLAPYYIDPADFRVQELKRYYDIAQDNHSAVRIVDDYLSFLFTELLNAQTIDYEETLLLKMNLFVLLLRYIIHRGPAPRIIDLTKHVSDKQNTLFTNLEKQNYTFFQEHIEITTLPWVKDNLATFTEDFTHAVFPVYKEGCKSNQLKVCILSAPDHYVRQTLKELLNQLSFVDLQFSEKVSEEVDFYITTFENLLPANNTTPYFVVDLVDNIDCQTKLFTTLWKNYQQISGNQALLPPLVKNWHNHL